MESRRITFNGLELFEPVEPIGGGDHPVVQSVDGIGGPAWSAPSGDRAGADGGWAGTPRRGVRPVSIDGTTISVDAIASEQWADRLIAAGTGKDLPLTFGYASGPRTMLVRVDGSIKIERRLPNVIRWQIPLVADDPAWYIGDGRNPTWEGTTARAQEVGGIIFPIQFPLLWDSGVVGGQLEYRNPGTTGRVDLRIDGPVVDPVITIRNADGTRVLAWTLTIPPGGFLTIDPIKRVALLQGQASRPPVQRGWPRLTPGSNQFQFHASGSSSGTLTVYAWPAF